MLLAIDVGNSALKGALFDNGELTTVFTIPTAGSDGRDPSSSSYWVETLTPHLANVSVDAVGLASVVPATAEAVTAALDQQLTAPVTRIGPDGPLPFDLAYETPETLGTDRLAAAAAGWVHVGQVENSSRSVIVVDAGTAVTCEVVHRDGVYLGGTISAGPELIRKSLRAGTAQLPDVPLTLPDRPVGRSTRTALQSGILWSLVDSVRGMTARLAGTLPDTPEIVLTGGWAPLLETHLDRTQHDPHLVLRGIQVLVRSTP